jgi:hypothetical protein
MVWKERNRGVFEDKHLSGLQLAHLIKEDILLFNSLPSFWLPIDASLGALGSSESVSDLRWSARLTAGVPALFC